MLFNNLDLCKGGGGVEQMVWKGKLPDQYFEPTLCELKDTLLNEHQMFININECVQDGAPRIFTISNICKLVLPLGHVHAYIYSSYLWA